MSKLVPLEKDIIFGPINSRRLGQSLGINLLPANNKICTFNCEYCFYSETNPVDKNKLPELVNVKNAIDNVIKKIENGELKVDFITLVGNGEPTLYPNFPEVVDYLISGIKTLNEKIKPGTAIFTNGTELSDGNIRDTVSKLDQAIVKIELADEEEFLLCNRPIKKIRLIDIVKASSELPNLRIQTAVYKKNGVIYNKKSLGYFCKMIELANPLELQLYNVIYPTVEKDIESVTLEELNDLANVLGKHLECKISVFND